MGQIWQLTSKQIATHCVLLLLLLLARELPVARLQRMNYDMTEFLFRSSVGCFQENTEQVLLEPSARQAFVLFHCPLLLQVLLLRLISLAQPKRVLMLMMMCEISMRCSVEPGMWFQEGGKEAFALTV